MVEDDDNNGRVAYYSLRAKFSEFAVKSLNFEIPKHI